FPAPIVLEIDSKNVLPQVARRQSTGDSALELRWVIPEKTSPIGKAPDSVRIRIRNHIEHHVFESAAKSKGMSALGEKRVVIRLQRIPVIKISWTASDSASEVGNTTTHQHLGCRPPRERCTSDPQVSPG